jgi:hypothetical protein
MLAAVATGAAGRPPLSDRRLALNRTITRIEPAHKAIATAIEPVRRCEVVITEAKRLQGDLVELRQVRSW